MALDADEGEWLPGGGAGRELIDSAHKNALPKTGKTVPCDATRRLPLRVISLAPVPTSTIFTLSVHIYFNIERPRLQGIWSPLNAENIARISPPAGRPKLLAVAHERITRATAPPPSSATARSQ